MFSGLKEKLRMHFVTKFLANFLKDAAEGKRGPKAKAAYWAVHRHALLVGVSAAALDGALRVAADGCKQCVTAETWLLVVAGALASSGLIIGFHASDPPKR